MHVLLVKMSSMGDLIHSLPALTDAMQAIPNLEIDWVAESTFADIPTWHPAVKKVIPIATRKWRKNIFSTQHFKEAKAFYQQLREKKYDAIIDPQGVLKSVVVSNLARGTTYGLDRHSTKGYFNGCFYNHAFAIEKTEHAITRIRRLFSLALNYPLPNTKPTFLIDPKKLPILKFETPAQYFVFLHGTTCETKHYPEIYWRQLLEKSNAEKITVYLLWGNETEKKRAEKLSKDLAYVKVLPRLSISEIATILKNASAVVSVDTGFGHLSAALTTPTIGIYGPTDSKRTGVVGDNQLYLQAQFPCVPCYSRTCIYAKTHKTDIMPACYTTTGPEKVWALIAPFIKA